VASNENVRALPFQFLHFLLPSDLPMSAEPPTHLLQLPRDVLLNILERCGPREKWALFMMCQSGRQLVLEAAQQITGSLYPAQLRRPSSLMAGQDGSWLESVTLQLKNIFLSGLLRFSGQLQGVKHLQLVRVIGQSVEQA
jgi:hypothetical protein